MLISILTVEGSREPRGNRRAETEPWAINENLEETTRVFAALLEIEEL
jgi:hypothetical protein